MKPHGIRCQHQRGHISRRSFIAGGPVSPFGLGSLAFLFDARQSPAAREISTDVLDFWVNKVGIPAGMLLPAGSRGPGAVPAQEIRPEALPAAVNPLNLGWSHAGAPCRQGSTSRTCPVDNHTLPISECSESSLTGSAGLTPLQQWLDFYSVSILW